MQEEEENIFEWVEEAADWTWDKVKQGYNAIKNWMCNLHVQPEVSVETTKAPGIEFQWSQTLIFANPKTIFENVKDMIVKNKVPKSSNLQQFIRNIAQFLGTDIRLKLKKLNIMSGTMK